MSITLMVDGPDPLNKTDQVRLITDPDAILAALADAGVLEVELGIMALTRRYVSRPQLRSLMMTRHTRVGCAGPSFNDP